MYDHSTIAIRERGGQFYARFKFWEAGTDGTVRSETSLWGSDKDAVKRKVNDFIGYVKYKSVAETSKSVAEIEKTATNSEK